jgi:Leucine-rich repeat (LRR) protein
MFIQKLTISRTLKSLGLDGQIPASIGDLEHLTWLDLGNNSFTEEIPPSIGALSLLTYLSLENNLLIGSIPPSDTSISAATCSAVKSQGHSAI